MEVWRNRRGYIIASVLAIALLLGGGITVVRLLSGSSKPAAIQLPTAGNYGVSPSRPSAGPVPSRHLESLYTTYYAGRPKFQCPDGRNAGLTYRDLKKFRQCPNQAFHLRLSHGVATLISHTGSVTLQANVTDEQKLDGTAPARGWIVRQYDRDGYDKLGYIHDSTITDFETYIKSEDEDNVWTIVDDLNKWVLYTQGRYDIVFTWVDPTKPRVDVKLPFSQDDVPNSPFMP